MKQLVAYVMFVGLCVPGSLLGAKKPIPSARAQQQARLAKIKAAHAAHKALYEQKPSSQTAAQHAESSAAAATSAQSSKADEEKRKADAAAAKKTEAIAQPWVCSACTFENAAARTVCEMCGAAKPAVVVSSEKGEQKKSGGDEKKESKEEKAALEKLTKEMAQLIARQKSLQADLLSAQSSVDALDDKQEQKSAREAFVVPVQKQLTAIIDQIKTKQAEIDKVSGNVASVSTGKSSVSSKPKDDAEMEKALAESLKDAERRAENVKASQQALEKAAAALRGEQKINTLVPVVPLVNVGATCFANATLQCLFQLSALQTLVLGLGDSTTWKAKHPKLEQQAIDFIAHYQRLVIALQGWVSATAFTPVDFCKAMRTRVFGSAGGMQDAAQFFGSFADDLGELSGKTPFDLAVNSTIVCHECKKPSAKMTTEHYLALSIAGGTLKDCLEQYIHGEELKGSEQYMCSQCKVKHDATKTLKVTNLPEILVLQLKRYTGTATITKITTAVSFPLTLGQEAFYQGDEKAAGVVYDLVGMVNHNGSFAGGHYTSYVKSSGDDKWHFCDDAAISERTADQVRVIADAGIDNGYRKETTPYLLFYIRRSEAKGSSAS